MENVKPLEKKEIQKVSESLARAFEEDLTLVLKLGTKILKRLDVASEIIAKLRAKYTKKESHWYLAIIGVDPNYQGKGFASILLKYLISTSDSYPIYLETFVEKNVPIYEHFNFKVVEIATVPDANIPIWAMLRK